MRSHLLVFLIYYENLQQNDNKYTNIRYSKKKTHIFSYRHTLHWNGWGYKNAGFTEVNGHAKFGGTPEQ